MTKANGNEGKGASGSRSLNGWALSSCRVAFAALLHDLGKLAERADLYDRSSEAWRSHVTLYCPYNSKAQHHTHGHAAATALAFDAIERFMPPVVGSDVSPFADAASADRDVTDSLINAAAAHHKPETFLQWCVASADRIASGFEREAFESYNQERDGHVTAQLLVPFEEIGRKQATDIAELGWRYPLAPLSVASLEPERANPARTKEQAVAEYRALWGHFLDALSRIPPGHRNDWPLWLDHFDAAWLSATHAIPSAAAFGTRPDVSLYDHSRATAAFAASIWRFHAERGDDPVAVAVAQRSRSDWDEQKFLLVQGDFAGIQAFIFGGSATTQKAGAKLLRGRSALVSLLCELAALKVLEALGLPPTSQIINAAGKFLIVAPNTTAVHAALDDVKRSLDEWFLTNSFGLASVVVAREPASCNDFIGKRFGDLRLRLGASLDVAKRRRFGLVGPDAPDPIRETAFLYGPCPFDGRMPADTIWRGVPCSRLSRDQIEMGSWLARIKDEPCIAVLRPGGAAPPRCEQLEAEYLGYRIALTDRQTAGGILPVRAFDVSLPGEDRNASLFAGFARRAINAHVPVLGHEQASDPRYDQLKDVAEPGDLKTFEHLAHDAQSVDERGHPFGVAALGVLKGDIDNLGRIFATALDERATFASWSALSRRLGAFFSVTVPHLCRSIPVFGDIYTVFAGGDDFYFIGPWRAVKRFAMALRDAFADYAAENPTVHFSASFLMAKPGHPLRALTSRAEAGLELAKDHSGKNAIHLGRGPDAGDVMAWPEFAAIDRASRDLDELVNRRGLSTAFLYDMLHLSDLTERARNGCVRSHRWRAMLHYRVRRHVEQGLRLRDGEARAAITDLVEHLGARGLSPFGGLYRHVLSDHIYGRRTA